MPHNLASAGVLLAVLLAACSPAPVDEKSGTPLDLAKAPHIRAGLWTLDAVLDGRQHFPQTRTCDAGRSIARDSQGGAIQWTGRRLADNKWLLLGSREDGGHLTHARIEVDGDLSSAFVMTTDSWTDGVLGGDRSSDVVAYRYVGPCPAGMIAETSWFPH